MKSPVYETSGGALETLLETGQFIEAFHYTYTLTDGTVLRFSAYDADISYGGHIWPAGAPQHDIASDASWHSGLDVDTWTYKVYPRLVDAVGGAAFPDLLEGTPWGQAARNGTLDGAVVEVLSAYAAAAPTDPASGFGVLAPTGVLSMFKGRVAAVDDLKSALSISINDFRELFGVNFPSNLWGAMCRHVLFDSGCTLAKATYKKSASVTTGPSRSTLTSTTIGTPAGGFPTWALGQIIFTSGQNAGFSRSVRSWDPTSKMLSLIAPLPFVPAPGDTFDAYPGCDRTYATCTAAGNTANYGGQRFIPPPEVAV